MSDAAPPRSPRLLATTVLAIFWGTTPPVWGFVLLAYLGPVSEWLRASGDMGVAVFVACFVVAAGVGLLPTYAQAILGGWAFGFGVGLGASIVGFVGGGLLGWLISRAISGASMEAWLDSKPKARIVRKALVGRGFGKSLLVVTLLRIPPNSPFALSNLAMAASGVGLAPYVLGTALGMLPRTAITCWVASHGGRSATDLQALIKDQGFGMVALGVAVLVVCLAAIGALGKAALRRATGEHAADAAGR